MTEVARPGLGCKAILTADQGSDEELEAVLDQLPRAEQIELWNAAWRLCEAIRDKVAK